MRFFESQEQARSQTHKLVAAFALTVLGLVLAVNAALALAWAASWGWGWGWFAGEPLHYPEYFFAVNTGMTLLFVLGGWWIETSSLHRGGAWMARNIGAREARPHTAAEQRLCNIADEMAIAAGMKRPEPMVMARVDAINAFAVGWDEDDAVVAVTSGALELLTREELQGLVAHEFGHIREGDTRLNMRLAGMVFGLEMIFNLGRSMSEADEEGRRPAWAVVGFAIAAAGSLGWLAGRVLKAAVSRQREFLADARAVQWTRSRDGLGGVLRKIMAQQAMRESGRTSWHPSVQHMLLAAGGDPDAMFATHPPLDERIRRIYGRSMGPLPLEAVHDNTPAVF
jgi:heat shock protein HtpX